MKYKPYFLLFAGLLLVSCSGTKIEMTEYIPAKLNLRRDSTVAITYSGYRADQMTNKLRDLMVADGYYKFVNSDYPDYSIGVTSDNTRLAYQVRYGKTGNVLYSNVVETSLKDVGSKYMELFHLLASICTLTLIPYNQDDYNIENRIAEDIYHSLAPHEKKYIEHVKASGDNPQLEQAVAACKKKNWALARELASAAIRQHPKDAEAYFLMGLLERNDAHYEESDNLFLKAMELDPKNEKYLNAYDKNTRMKQNEVNVINQLSN